MGLLDKTKSPPAPPLPHSILSNTTTASNNNSKNSYKINSNKKKGTYTISNENNNENVDPKKINDKTLNTKQINVYHDNPAFEDDKTNPFLNESVGDKEKKEIIQLENQNYEVLTNTTIVYITSQSNKTDHEIGNTVINTAEKLAAAAAATVSSTSVEIPNFGEELSSMMQQNRMDEIEISSNKFDTQISQSHGFTFGEGNNLNKSYTKTANNVTSNNITNMNSDSTTVSEDDPNLKLTNCSSYDIKVRRRRACHLKALVILLAMVTAGLIGCLFSYYFMRYKALNERYLNYTQNMVRERNSKIGSNKLKIQVPFNSNVDNFNDKSILVNKVQEIVMQSFLLTNKTVEVIKLDELNEIDKHKYIALIDVELKDAREFSTVPLLKQDNEDLVKVANYSSTLKTYRDTFLNLTVNLNLNSNILKIDCDNIDIIFEIKSTESTEVARLFTNSSKIFTSTTSASSTSSTSPTTRTTQTTASPTTEFISKSTTTISILPEIKLETKQHFPDGIIQKILLEISTTQSTIEFYSSTITSTTTTTTTTLETTTTTTTSLSTSTIASTTTLETTTKLITTSTFLITTSTTNLPSTTSITSTINIETTKLVEETTTIFSTTTEIKPTTTLETSTTTFFNPTESSTLVSVPTSGISRIFVSTPNVFNGKVESIDEENIDTDAITTSTKLLLDSSSSISTPVNDDETVNIKEKPKEKTKLLKYDFYQKQKEFDRLLKLIKKKPGVLKDDKKNTYSKENTGFQQINADKLGVNNKELVVDLVLNDQDLNEIKSDSTSSSETVSIVQLTSTLPIDSKSSSEELSKNHNDMDIVIQIDDTNDQLLSKFLTKLKDNKDFN